MWIVWLCVCWFVYHHLSEWLIRGVIVCVVEVERESLTVFTLTLTNAQLLLEISVLLPEHNCAARYLLALRLENVGHTVE